MGCSRSGGSRGVAGQGAGTDEDGTSKAPPPRLRSNSYYSIPLLEHSSHSAVATAGDHRQLADTYGTQLFL